jgi:hypothetical protein
MTFIIKVEKTILKFKWKPRRAKAILSKREQISDFKTYCRVIVTKTMWYQHRRDYRDQWKRTENPEIGPCMYSQLILNRHAKTYTGQKPASLTSSVGNIGWPHAENRSLTPLTLYKNQLDMVQRS